MRRADTTSSFSSSPVACPFGASIAAGVGGMDDRPTAILVERIDQSGWTFSAPLDRLARRSVEQAVRGEHAVLRKASGVQP